MKLAEAWRLSRMPYREVVYRSLAEERGRMWWGAFGHGQSSKEDHNDLELTNKALRIAKFDKSLVSIFNIIISLAPFAVSFLGAAAFELASSIALSLAVTFGFTTLYAIQTLSSFVSAESSVLLTTLPIAGNDFSLITLFSFVRSVDYMVIGAVLSQVAAVAILTNSFFATLIMLVAATLNQIFAASIALWFSRVFQKNSLQEGRSKIHTFFRAVFILMWSLLLVAVGFLFSIPWYIVPNLENILLGAEHVSNLLLGLLYPFSTGILIASLTYSKVALLTIFVAAIAFAGYSLLGVFAGRWSLKTVKRISQGYAIRINRIAAKDFSIKNHSPMFGYILKDITVASRNPATAFFFALPVLETVIIAILVSNLSTMRTAVVLDATSMGAIFALFVPLALLTAEGKGLEYTKTLPINSRRIIISKTLLSTGTYALVPLAMTALSVVKPLNSSSSILIPFLITISVASASVFEIKLFLRVTAKGKIDAIANDIGKIIVGVISVLAPLFTYACVFLSSNSHSLSLMAMGAVALSELTIALYLLRRSGI